MPEPDSQQLYTLTDVAKVTNISMPTLQRYKKLYQDRIPSQGSGRSQRYPKEALDIFLTLKQENIGKRGRPRKTAAEGDRAAARKAAVPAKRGRKPAAGAKPAAATKSAKPAEGLLTLTEIGQLTKISYPTLLRYVKTHIREIPHRGTGRARRYLPEAVDVFKRLRSESGRGRGPAAKPAKVKGRPGRKPAAAAPTGRRRGRPPAAAKAVGDGDMAARVKSLEKTQKQLERLVGKLEKEIQKPLRVTLGRK